MNEAEYDEDLRYCFNVEYYDHNADLIREYQLMFFPVDNSIEMYDIKQKKIYLKRVGYPGIQLRDFVIGATVIIFSRPLLIKSYGDKFTASKLISKLERALLVVRLETNSLLGDLFNFVIDHGYTIIQMRSVKFSDQAAQEFLSISYSSEDTNKYKSKLSGGLIYAFTLMKENCVNSLNSLLGPEDLNQASINFPDSIRGYFITDKENGFVHASKNLALAEEEINFMFGSYANSMFERTAKFKDCTLALIKPHILKQGLIGEIITAIIKGGYEINDIQLFNLETANATEFLEVYKGLMPTFMDHVNELISGASVAMEISHPSMNQEQIVTEFRKFVGPYEPCIGKQIFPMAIRSVYGYDWVHNALHCTDLPEDGPMESDYFFNILCS
ncbi:nucleoside diphosphate kinase 7 [Neocallimastix lanati (nom. inval.)]|jgi:nucleoside-diphosphate kinase|uniref:Nucleoside diphosphate kinase n=1 Tax=Neocallimastix californiae TaxID=1754190 RepID=A0A1Y2FFU4_9FUNG|nr:nucleoside diphosphate kinase 7 [Neocallimastix sp. JGI-2020a]ORY82830.1 nucleoside diphosphate kinase 7 [Neocallimastix californiae]|eukprot:ORY82830.1 nucleoside diphosphate kinase 7 [Neocallimastix californiae]